MTWLRKESSRDGSPCLELLARTLCEWNGRDRHSFLSMWPKIMITFLFFSCAHRPWSLGSCADVTLLLLIPSSRSSDIGRVEPPHSEDEPTLGKRRSVAGGDWKMALWLCTVEKKDLFLGEKKKRDLFQRVTAAGPLTSSICVWGEGRRGFTDSKGRGSWLDGRCRERGEAEGCSGGEVTVKHSH